MTSLDGFIRAWPSHAWPLSLVITLSLGVVLLLRVPCRRWFGAERAFQLWLLVPLLTLLASWPHAPRVDATNLPPVVLRIVTVPTGVAAATAAVRPYDWLGLLVLGWAVGMLVTLAFAAVAQTRFRRRLAGARRSSSLSDRWPVLHAAQVDVGPALIGLWRPQIIVPADFETRYGPTERTLILAHEAMHARRGDVWLSLAAQLMTSAFWFLPFRGFAMNRFRHDQELACDAAVLREHPTHRRSYAQAMLKTQVSRLALPVGCLWSSRHPVTERIAMLKQKPPRTIRQLSGLVALITLGLGMGQLVFAAGSAAQADRTDAARDTATARPAAGFTLRLMAASDGRAVRLRGTSCFRDGDFYTFDEQAAGGIPPWHGRFTVIPAGNGLLETRADLSGGSLPKPIAPRVRMRPGQPGGIQVGEVVHGEDGRSTDRTLKLELTAWPGCVKPAQSEASDDLRLRFDTNSARAVAQGIAQQSGLTIENPESLDDTKPIKGNFEGVPPEVALWIIGNMLDMTATVDGKRVRFTPK